MKKRLGSDDLPPETRGEDGAEAPASGLTPPPSTVEDDVLTETSANPDRSATGHDDLIAGHEEVSAGVSNDSAGGDGLQGEQIDPEDAIEAASDGQPDVNDTVRAAFHYEDEGEDEPEDEDEATQPLEAGDIYEGVEVLNDQKRPIDAPVSDGDGVWQSFDSNRLKVGHIVRFWQQTGNGVAMKGFGAGWQPDPVDEGRLCLIISMSDGLDVIYLTDFAPPQISNTAA